MRQTTTSRPARRLLTTAALAVTLAATSVAASPSATATEPAGTAAVGPTTSATTSATTSVALAAAERRDDAQVGRTRGHATRAKIRVATLNIKNTLSAGAVRHDVAQLIDRGDPSIVGFQERGGSKATMRSALPKSWRLVMPTKRPGTDLNPIAFDTREWRLKKPQSYLLTSNTWRRNRGNIAVDQYAVVATLKHRDTRRVVRAVSFHMPSEIQNHRTGGPNFNQRDRVEAFWRMSSSLTRLAKRTSKKAQVVAMCDCNVRASLDRGDDLVRGRITGPARLSTNYYAEAAGKRRSIDYVMAERRQAFRIRSWFQVDAGLATDHPGVVSILRESKGSFAARTR